MREYGPVSVLGTPTRDGKTVRVGVLDLGDHRHRERAAVRDFGGPRDTQPRSSTHQPMRVSMIQADLVLSRANPWAAANMAHQGPQLPWRDLPAIGRTAQLVPHDSRTAPCTSNTRRPHDSHCPAAKYLLPQGLQGRRAMGHLGDGCRFVGGIHPGRHRIRRRLPPIHPH
jgi:hypothetical protein